MNFIKSLLFTVLMAITMSSFADTWATNVTTGGTYLISTNRASVYQVELTSTTGTLVQFYDAESLAAPYYGTNYVSAAYPYRSTYATNYVTSYIGSNGYTNWYTNAGVWTVTLTNAAATNALRTLGAFVVSANTYAVYNTDMLAARGLVFTTTTNVAVVVNYH